MKNINRINYYQHSLFPTMAQQRKKMKQLYHTDTLNKKIQIQNKTLKPVFGYRFVIDFDGIEKLIEHFVSGIDNKKTNKFYEGLTDYEQLELLEENPISFVSDDKRIDTLHIFRRTTIRTFLPKMKETSMEMEPAKPYVINWADQSNINTWHLLSYKNNKGQKFIHSQFGIATRAIPPNSMNFSDLTTK